MKILAHRGCWDNQIYKNSYDALRIAMESGFGFESDVRDHNGKLVISHDIANDDCIEAEQIFSLLAESDNECCFAINIKSDGLKELLNHNLKKYKISNYFLFDMSIPQMMEFKEAGLRFFTRQSEVEIHPNLYNEAAGVWIDGFWSTDWITKDLLDNHIKNDKDVCIVSPELHGMKDYKIFWKKLINSKIELDKIMLCTDYPKEAREFFYGTEN